MTADALYVSLNFNNSERLLQSERYSMQMRHSGVVAIDGGRVTARFVERERGRGDGTYYDNLAVYDDVLVREPGGWRFLERHYRYRFLDQKPFEGDAFPGPGTNASTHMIAGRASQLILG